MKGTKESGTNHNVGEGFDEIIEQAFDSLPTHQIPSNQEKVEDFFKRDEKPPQSRKIPARRKKKSARRKAPARKPAAKEPEPEPVYVPFSLFDKSLMKIIAGMIPFSILATYAANEKYLLTDKEKETLALQWDAVAHKYVPDLIEEYGPEATLLSTIGLFLVAKSGVFDGAAVPRKSNKGAENESV